MTWKEKRIVTVLSAILAVLAAALLIVLSLRYREHREQNQTLVTPQGEVVSAQEYTQLNYFNSVAAPSFSCNGDKGWSWSDEPDFPQKLHFP